MTASARPKRLLRALAVLSQTPAAWARATHRIRRHADPAHRRLATSLGLDRSSNSPDGCRLPTARDGRRPPMCCSSSTRPPRRICSLPSKLIDYLPQAKPILALTPPRGASADLVRALGYPVIAPDDEAGIVAALHTLLTHEAGGPSRSSASHREVAKRTTSAGPPRPSATILVPVRVKTSRADGDGRLLSLS